MAFREDHLEAARDRFGTSGVKPRVGYRGPAFFKSCISGDLKSIDKYLASKGTDASGKSTVVDDMDDLGLTPLMYACAHNQSAVVRRLLRAGADPTVTTGIAMSAYEYAAIGNAEGGCAGIAYSVNSSMTLDDLAAIKPKPVPEGFQAGAILDKAKFPDVTEAVATFPVGDMERLTLLRGSMSDCCVWSPEIQAVLSSKDPIDTFSTWSSNCVTAALNGQKLVAYYTAGDEDPTCATAEEAYGKAMEVGARDGVRIKEEQYTAIKFGEEPVFLNCNAWDPSQIDEVSWLIENFGAAAIEFRSTMTVLSKVGDLEKQGGGKKGKPGKFKTRTFTLQGDTMSYKAGVSHGNKDQVIDCSTGKIFVLGMMFCLTDANNRVWSLRAFSEEEAIWWVDAIAQTTGVVLEDPPDTD